MTEPAASRTLTYIPALTGIETICTGSNAARAPPMISDPR